MKDRRYQPLCRFASGGMAEVWLARTTGIGGFERLVVLKRLLPQLARMPSYVSRFLDEARLAASLDHPNVVQVIDVGIEGGFPFLAMEHLFGRDVSAVLGRSAELARPIPLAQALAIVMGVCAGLHHAHDKVGADGRPLGLVHRDVTPHNVLVTYTGAVKVIDFGIAKATALDRDATTTGVLRGKLGYMSPEQYRGLPVDRRSDVFAVGVMLYELTVGKRPFDAETPIESILQAATGAVKRPSSIDPSYPEELERIVLAALAVDADQRPATALQLQDELGAFAKASQLDVSPHGVARVMEELFEADLHAWRSAESEGRALWEHLQSIHARPPGDGPVTRTASAPAPKASRSRRALWPIALGAGLCATGIVAWSARPRTAAAPPPVAIPSPAPAPMAAPPPDPAPEPAVASSARAPDPPAAGSASHRGLHRPAGHRAPPPAHPKPTAATPSPPPRKIDPEAAFPE